MALVTIALPVYQGISYLEAAVSSVLSQTLTDFELLIGDDGSTDGSREYLATLRDPRVRLFTQPTRLGLFANLNQLVAEAKAPLIRVLCQDDVLEANCLERELQFFGEHPEIALSIAKYQAINSASQTVAVPTLHDLPAVLPSALAVQHFFYHGCIAGNLSTVCVRRSVLQELGSFDTSFSVSGDYELWARIARHYPIGMVHEPLLKVRTHSGQLSRARTSALPFVHENARVRDALRSALPSQVSRAARRFERNRHHVLDFHLALRRLLEGNVREAWAIYRHLGAASSLRAFGAWLVTLNNRRRPQAPWVHS